MRITRESVHHPDGSLRCMQLRLAAFGGGLHRHRHAELTWIERGRGLRWVGDSVEPFVDGDLVLIGGETAHLWATRGAQSPEGCAATVLQFPPEGLARSGLPELHALRPLLARAAAGLQVQGEPRAEVQRLLLRLREAPPLRRLALMIDVLAVLLEGGAELRPLSGRPRGLAEADGRAGPARIDRVLSWIESRLAQELRVDEAAAVAHVSPAAFARFFRREVGKSFTEYVNDARCGWAALRLMQGHEPVAQIALDCGFPTLSNFGEQFRRRHGMSARAFRAHSPAIAASESIATRTRAGTSRPEG